VGLPKQHRLKRRQDFSSVYQRGTRFKSNHLMLRRLRRSVSAVKLNSSPQNNPPLQHDHAHQQPTRIGISISTKVDKRAVVRNRLRRQIQALVRRHLPNLANGWDLLIVVHPEAVKCDRLQFLQELEQLLQDAEVLNGC
jgi:ribonuclease P protein component